MMKRKILIEIDCEEKHCGECRCRDSDFFPDVDCRALDADDFLKVDGLWATFRLPECLAAEQAAGEIKQAIQTLLDHLPDSIHEGEEGGWRWCWDELFSDAQEAVKAARAAGRKALESLPDAE